MIWFQVVTLLLVVAGGTAVVLTREPKEQILVAGGYGLLLSLLFFAFQAPDVALSEIAAGAVGLPTLLLLALARTEGRRR